MELLDLDPQFVAQLGVEIGERLVEQEDVDIADQRAADGDALALAAGELGRLAVEQRLELQELGRLGDAFGDFVLWELGDPEAEGEILSTFMRG